MATILWPFPVNFGSSSAGHTGSVKYLIVDANGVQRSPGGGFAFSTSGVAESTYCPGKYEVSMTIDTAWLPLDITWQDTIAGVFVPDKLYAGDVLSAIALPAIAAGAAGGLAISPISVSVVSAGAVGFSGALGGQGVVLVDLRDQRIDIIYPRDTQKSVTILLGVPITGRLLSWFVKAQKLDSAPILMSHDTTPGGGITLNTVPETHTVLVNGIPTPTVFAVNQVATLTISDGDFDITKVDGSGKPIFPPNTPFWQVFQLGTPEEKGSWGAFQLVEEP